MSSVDVIVPCYRYGHFLKECVDSVLAQSGPSVRVLIIDDASPDNTAEVATELARHESRVTFLRHTSNKGHIATYNEGLEWVAADYLLLLSADDYLLPGALSRAAALMNAHAEVSFTFGAAVILHSDGSTALDLTVRCSGASTVLKGHKFLARMGGRNLVTTPTAVVRTKVQKLVGGYCFELPHAGDVEMWLRLAAHGPVGYIKTPQAVRRRHPTNMCLAYSTNGGLGDCEQRETALHLFFSRYGDHIPRRLRRRAAYQLSCDAIDNASAAWEEGRMKDFQQLIDFALRNCPEATRSLHWAKLSLKRSLGVPIYGRLRSLLGR
jgi:glycosyltransferase involved in cell wall biosynthesis